MNENEFSKPQLIPCHVIDSPSFSLQYAGIRIGPVVKRDVMKASIMLEHQSE